MRETLMFGGRRTTWFVQPGAGATELAGSSAAISHVHEIVRRVAALDGNVLLIARRGCDVQSVAREIHARSPVGAHAFVSVTCGGAGVEQVLFGDPGRAAPPD